MHDYRHRADVQCVSRALAVPPKSFRYSVGRVDSRGIGGVHGHADEGENIRVLVEPADISFKRLDAGEIHNAMLIIALQWLALHRDSLRNIWLV